MGEIFKRITRINLNIFNPIDFLRLDITFWLTCGGDFEHRTSITPRT
jgi:hypothetical protein